MHIDHSSIEQKSNFVFCDLFYSHIGINSNKSGSFIGFSIALLWLNQKTQRSDWFEAVLRPE